MNDTTLRKITAELESVLTGQKFGKIFLLSRLQAVIDFRLSSSRYLFISIEPTAPRVYIINRRLRDLERQSKTLTHFFQLLRKKLSNAFLQKIEKIENERILRLSFSNQNELGEQEDYVLIIQLTGRSANLFLLNKNDFIVDALRENFGPGQEIGNRYAPPARAPETRPYGGDTEIFPQENFDTLSEALDEFYLEKDAEKVFRAETQAARNKLKQETAKREKLVRKLNHDLENHGNADKWKRYGDLLLANLATAERENNMVLVMDFFDENVPVIEIEVDENLSLTDAAGKFFKRYTKARNAKKEISKRLAVLDTEIKNLNLQNERLEEAIAKKDPDILAEFIEEKIVKPQVKIREKQNESFKGARRFVSNDGFEILVGKGAKDNDFLTFRVAKSSDLWLHAADYPGSHVVVKNPNRQEIPAKTLLEAAQIAAFYSHAREQPKVAVHYTQKKFVNKPKGAAHGLVSLASFKTILVEPKVGDN